MRTYRLWINNTWSDASADQWQAVIDPAMGEEVGRDAGWRSRDFVCPSEMPPIVYHLERAGRAGRRCAAVGR
jgi:hypothetical protein